MLWLITKLSAVNSKSYTKCRNTPCLQLGLSHSHWTYFLSHYIQGLTSWPFRSSFPSVRIGQITECPKTGTVGASILMAHWRCLEWDLPYAEDITLEGVGKSSLKTDESLQEIRHGAQDTSLNFKCKAQFFVLVLPTGTNSRRKGGLAKEKESALSNGLLVDHHTWDWCLI